jgi:hypothetical protein
MIFKMFILKGYYIIFKIKELRVHDEFKGYCYTDLSRSLWLMPAKLPPMYLTRGIKPSSGEPSYLVFPWNFPQGEVKSKWEDGRGEIKGKVVVFGRVVLYLYYCVYYYYPK